MEAGEGRTRVRKPFRGKKWFRDKNRRPNPSTRQSIRRPNSTPSDGKTKWPPVPIRQGQSAVTGKLTTKSNVSIPKRDKNASRHSR